MKIKLSEYCKLHLTKLQFICQNSRDDDTTSESDVLGEGELGEGNQRFHGTGKELLVSGSKCISMEICNLQKIMLQSCDQTRRQKRKSESETQPNLSRSFDDVAGAPDPHPPDLVPAEGRPRRHRRVAPWKGIGGKRLISPKVIFLLMLFLWTLT